MVKVTEDDLYRITIKVDALKKAGKGWDEAKKLLIG